MKTSAYRSIFHALPEQQLLVLSYVVAHCGVFFVLPAIYWDDWVLFGHAAGDILARFKMAGTPFGLYAQLHNYMQLLGPIGYKCATFLLYLGSAVTFYKILARQQWLTSESRFLIALLFAVLPFNFARLIGITLPYALSNFLFFLAWYWLLTHKVLAGGLFLFAFFTQSYLVFYLFPILELLRRELFLSGFSWRRDLPREALLWTLRNLPLVALPVVVFLIKTLYFPPTGFYAGYNEGFGLEKLWPTLKIVYSDFIGQDLSLPLLVIGLLLARALLSRVKGIFPDCRVLLAGLIAIALALFPYLILGLAPVFDEWPASRHQLLLPLGVACLTVGGAAYLRPALARHAVGLVLAISFAMNFNAYYIAYLDWRKQTAVLEFLRDSDFKQADVILLDDRTETRFRRTLGFYEWSGIVRLAYGDDRRFAMRIEEYPNYLGGRYDQYFLPMYNAGHHTRRDENAVRVLVIDYVKQIGAPPLMFGRQNYSIRLTPIESLRKDLCRVCS